MMETVIAISVGVVVAGGILTLVWRILAGDREQRRLEEQLSRLSSASMPSASETGTSPSSRTKAS
ncbi:MAG: hypothetical protein ACO3JL_06050 [Myxococcota bacterium]